MEIAPGKKDTRRSLTSHGFTIVELTIIIVVIAILATLGIVGYAGVSSRAKETSLKSDLDTGSSDLQLIKSKEGSFPKDASTLKKSTGTILSYLGSKESYCLTATSNDLPGVSFYITQDNKIQTGSCPVAPAGTAMQAISNVNCPTTRTRVYDARDNHSYWAQRLADGKCWMLTNLAYAGGGTSSYGDTKALTTTTGNTVSYTAPQYYVIPGSVPSFTTNPANPSTATTGTSQYGYLYNWCGAMGAQTATSACMNAASPAPDTSVSVCPAGWSMPTGGNEGTSNELYMLNAAINGGSTWSNDGLMNTWLAQYNGGRSNLGAGFQNQGDVGYYWSSTQYSTANGYSMWVNPYTTDNQLGDATNISTINGSDKTMGLAVRCIAR